MLTLTAMTHVGLVRARNEDALVLPGLMSVGSFDRPLVRDVEPRSGTVLAVLDGMGGHRDGQFAARLAAQHLLDNPPTDASEGAVRSLLADANARLFDAMRLDPSHTGMGAAVAGLAFTERRAWAFNVGDARIYQLADGYPVRVSVDDRAGGSNALTQSLGGTDQPTTIDAHVAAVDLPPVGGSILLCSDGLSEFVGLGDIGDALTQGGAEAVDALLRGVWAAGAADNVSFCIVSDGGD